MGILQARILEWFAMPPTPGDLPNPRDQIQISHIVGEFFTVWATMLQPHKRGSIIILWKRIVGFFPLIEVLLLISGDFIHQISWILYISLPEKYFCPHFPRLPSFTRETRVGLVPPEGSAEKREGSSTCEVRGDALAVWELILVCWWVLFLGHFLKSWIWMPCRWACAIQFAHYPSSLWCSVDSFMGPAGSVGV